MIESQPFQTDSAVYNQVLSLLRSSLWGETRFPCQTPGDADWDAIYRELRHQTVQHLAVDLLAREDPARLQQYIARAARNMMHWYRIMQTQQEVFHLLEAAGIPCAVAKGASAACYYPQPAHRSMGDIDLLVHPADFDRACRIISEGAEYLGENFRHLEFKRNGIVVEVHRAFSTFRSSEQRELFDRRIFDAIRSAETVTTEGYCFPRLPRTENGLILLEHIDIHLENGLGLRQIIDWMMFADQVLSDEFWHSEFAPFVKQLDRMTLAVTVTRMCQMYLGLRTDITWCREADEDLCTRLMDYILSQGNFGRKNQSGSNRAADLIQVSRNIPQFFRVLQHRGRINWKASDRYPVLRPFAWVYQLFRYLIRGLRSGHPLRLLLGASREAPSRTALFEDLGVSRMSQEGGHKQ